MTQEEKAKRYDERLEKARKWYDANTNEGYRQIFEDIFPELKESDDEKMKKIISDILLIDSDEIREILDANNVLMQDVYAWLEKQGKENQLKGTLGDVFDDLKLGIDPSPKQGEQKITPIFRIGDTIIAKDETYIEKEPFHIDRIEDDCYWDGENTIFVCNQDEFEIFEQKSVESDCYSKKEYWQGYKDGVNDSDFAKSLTCLEKQGEQKFIVVPKFKVDDVIKNKKTGDEVKIVKVDIQTQSYNYIGFDGAATIHSDFLFSDQDNYELVEQKPNPWEPAKLFSEGVTEVLKHPTNYGLQKMEQKPVEWSDTTIIKELINFFDNHIDSVWEEISNNDVVLSWLKSLKERVQPQNFTVTDEELIKARNEAYNDTLDKLEYHSDTPTFNDGWSAAIWYLKKRNSLPQSTWKPSKEQMKALKFYIDNNMIDKDGVFGCDIVGLYEQLKEL